MPFQNAFKGKRVLITGHTGFKGSWLTAWLLELGAKVAGYALPPVGPTPLFDQLGLASRVDHECGDIRDLTTLSRRVREYAPEFVFHLAAQPLVRLAYREPVETYAVNVMGTVNVLEALRTAGRPCTVVCVTTDKCYENQEWVHSYRETDPLGGRDPYSSSKAAAEIVARAYRDSFFKSEMTGLRLATARSGNVIGGGDWAEDRIVPDCIRALQQGVAVTVRNRRATRPWQHVLEPLSGYLELAASLQAAGPRSSLASAFNFGPPLSSNRTVGDLAGEILKHWPGTWIDRTDPGAPHEATLLNLSVDKAHHILGWRPIWSFEETVAQTVAWYRHAIDCPKTIPQFTFAQIAAYVEAASRAEVAWEANQPGNGCEDRIQEP